MSDPHDFDKEAASASGSGAYTRRQFGALTATAGLATSLPAAAAAQGPDRGGEPNSPVAGPKPLGGELRTLKIVSTEATPSTMFVCSATVRSDAAAALSAMFQTGAALPKGLQASYDKHLRHSHDVGERFYEAGPSADFTEILYIFKTASLDEAKALMQADPFHREGIFHDDIYFPWGIHCPSYKSGTAGGQPEQVVPTEVEVTTPRWLIAAYGTYIST